MIKTTLPMRLGNFGWSECVSGQATTAVWFRFTEASA